MPEHVEIDTILIIRGCIKLHITNYLGLPKGHAAIPFIDITTRRDTKLFLDPCLIERCDDDLSRQAAALIMDYEDCLYADMRNGRWHFTPTSEEAHEIHETKLGYGNGRNGKGTSPDGMRDSLNGLCMLANGITTISRIQDISVFVEDFAEDRMSDLLTNILRQLLCQFTAEQMQAFGKAPGGTQHIKAWDVQSHGWVTYSGPYWLVDGQKVLLVPKWWVRKNYLFKAHQYLYGVIIERMQRDAGLVDLTKADIWRNMERDSEHWEYNKVIEYTYEDPAALDAYHARMPSYYGRAKGCMSDADLDEAVYGHRITRTA